MAASGALLLLLLCAPAGAAGPGVAASTAAAPSPSPSAAALSARYEREPSARARLELVRQLAQPPLRTDAARLLLSRAAQSDLSDQVRAAASIALLSFRNERAYDAVGQALAAEQGEGVRLAVCKALAKDSDPDAAVTDALASLLSTDASPAVRLQAALGLAARGDRAALPVLNQAALHDADRAVRKAARQAFARLFAPPVKPAPKRKPKPVERVDETGHLHCGDRAGVCQCTDGVIAPRPHCLSFEDCRHLYETTYQNEGGFSCSWDGQDVELQQ